MSGVTAMSQNRSCGSYGPGHLMHWIQGKKSHEDGQPIIKVKVVAVHDDGRVEIEGDDLKLTLWYHDPDRLRSALIFGGRAEWKPNYHVLYVISSGPFNLATVDKVEPCVPAIRRRPTETTRQFIGRAMRENHGYTVLQQWLADLDAIPDSDTGEPQSGYLVGADHPNGSGDGAAAETYAGVRRRACPYQALRTMPPSPVSNRRIDAKKRVAERKEGCTNGKCFALLSV
jgi:hypothetical protein